MARVFPRKVLFKSVVKRRVLRLSKGRVRFRFDWNTLSGCSGTFPGRKVEPTGRSPGPLRSPEVGKDLREVGNGTGEGGRY